jgi:hypothetical protein
MIPTHGTFVRCVLPHAHTSVFMRAHGGHSPDRVGQFTTEQGNKEIIKSAFGRVISQKHGEKYHLILDPNLEFLCEGKIE